MYSPLFKKEKGLRRSPRRAQPPQFTEVNTECPGRGLLGPQPPVRRHVWPDAPAPQCRQMNLKSGPSHRTSEQGALEPEPEPRAGGTSQGRCGRRGRELTQQAAVRGPGETLQSSDAPAVRTAHRLRPVRGNKPEGATAFRNKIYSNLKQNSFQEKDMKSQLPSALSG